METLRLTLSVIGLSTLVSLFLVFFAMLLHKLFARTTIYKKLHLWKVLDSSNSWDWINLAMKTKGVDLIRLEDKVIDKGNYHDIYNFINDVRHCDRQRLFSALVKKDTDYARSSATIHTLQVDELVEKVLREDSLSDVFQVITYVKGLTQEHKTKLQEYMLSQRGTSYLAEMSRRIEWVDHEKVLSKLLEHSEIGELVDFFKHYKGKDTDKIISKLIKTDCPETCLEIVMSNSLANVDDFLDRAKTLIKVKRGEI